MRVLFIHNNFPAQFVHLARVYASNKQNEVVFMAQHGRDELAIPDVRIVKVEAPKLGVERHTERIAFGNFYNGELFGRAMMELAKEGFFPDIVYDHPGWGCSAYVADIFPAAVRITYPEWFYTKGANHHFFSGGKPQAPAAFAGNRQTNLAVFNALHDCDAAIIPTLWQFSQFPVEFTQKYHVMHDGIPTEVFTPKEQGAEEDSVIQGLDLAAFPEIVTYATRGLEPFRGFPQFYRAVPKILAQRPQCHVVIMANDTTHYSPKRQDGKGWGEFMREEVPVDKDRVHFLKFDSYLAYRKLLRASSLHVYLTAPFVLSWSLLEAMSTGCLVLASDTQPVREVVTHTENGFLTSFWDTDELSALALRILENREKYDEVRKNARKTIVDRYDLNKMLPQQIALAQQLLVFKRLVISQVRRQSEAQTEAKPGDA